VAVVLSVLSIIGGKYAAVKIAFSGSRSPFQETLNRIDGDTAFVVSYLADSVAEAYEGQGRTIVWPDPSDESRDEPADYPEDVWSAAQTRWDSMSTADQDAYRQRLRDRTSQMAALVQPGMMMEAFKGTFGALDLVFLGLAIFTAWRIAAGKTEAQAEPVSSEEPPAG
jgi:hypothetical protein